MLRSVLTLCAVALCLLGTSCRKLQTSGGESIDPDRYYAVMLTTGSVYFGKLEGLGTPFPVLHDVYYVQSGVNPETKEPTNVLVKRGKEWHAPDRMIVGEKAIIFIEPVGPGSKVAQLIAESKR